MTSDLVILGATGSIGTQALEVVSQNPDRFCVRALAAGGGRAETLAEQAVTHDVEFLAIADSSRANTVLELVQAREKALGVTSKKRTVFSGPDAAAKLAGLFPEARVLNGITGGVGLVPTLAALRCGATVALANKESLVVGGSLVQQAMVRPGQIVPVDSEHSAMAQALHSGIHEKGLTSSKQSGRSEVSRLILTASGGPFRGRKRPELQNVIAAAALEHPTWKMGPVVTINSATLMNKGLELIEASLLFDIPPEQIVPVVHPQSVIHSMVEWQDGSTIAQASPPDMKLPIALGLCDSERLPEVATPCSWDEPVIWNFEAVDHETFPALNLAKQAIAASPTHPAVLNAANEVCVAAFLNGGLSYLGIVDTVSQVLDMHSGIADPELEDILEVQSWAQSRTRQLITD